jgi:hypothetical protein
MNTKNVLVIAALLITSQAYALTAAEKNHGCPPDTECPFGGGNSGGGGSDYTGAWIYEGSLWESFEDSQGGFDIETNLSTGKKTVHMGNVAAFLIKPPPPNSEMKRSKLVHGPLAPSQSLAETKKKAEQKAQAEAIAKKAAADKAAADKLAAEKAAAEKLAAEKAAALKAANYAGPPLSTSPAAGLSQAARKKP